MSKKKFKENQLESLVKAMFKKEAKELHEKLDKALKRSHDMDMNSAWALLKAEQKLDKVEKVATETKKDTNLILYRLANLETSR